MAKRLVHDAAVPLPELIRGYRHARGVTQVQFGALVGIRPAMIGHVEAGRRSLSVENVEKIARALELTQAEARQLRQSRDAASAVSRHADETPEEMHEARVKVLKQLLDLSQKVEALRADVDGLMGDRSAPGSDRSPR